MKNCGFKAVIKSKGWVKSEIPWLEPVSDYGQITLSKDTSKHDTDRFIAEMFNYKHIDAGKTVDEGIRNALALAAENERFIVMGGGVMFYNGDKQIYPQCCCGIETFKDILHAIEAREGIWLGHDPFPYFDYTETELVVCLSEELESNIHENSGDFEKFSVSFDYSEIPELTASVTKEFFEFITIPLRNRLITLGASEVDAFISAALKSFGYSEKIETLFVLPTYYKAKRFTDMSKYRSWSKIRHGSEQCDEIVSCDMLLCPPDGKEYSYCPDFNLENDEQYIGYFRNPLRPYDEHKMPENFEFCGYDLFDEFSRISAVTNCGDFHGDVIDFQNLNRFGLIDDYEKAKSVKQKLLEVYPHDAHSDCEVYEIWRKCASSE